MSVATQFVMYPYVKNGKRPGFHIPGEHDTHLFSEEKGKYPDLILQDLRKNISAKITQGHAKALQNALNQMIKNQSNNYQALIDKTIEDLNSDLLEQLQNLKGKGKGGSIVVFNNGMSFSLSSSLAQKYDQTLRDLAKETFGEENIKADASLKAILDKFNGKLNALRGDIFENLLAYVLEDSAEIIKKILETETKNLTEEFVDGCSKGLKNSFSCSVGSFLESDLSIVEKNKSNSFARVTGADIKDTISFTVDNKGYKVSGSKGKTDVAISTRLDGNFADSASVVGITAKSYNGSRRIHLVSNANLAGLIAQWSATDRIKSLALNGFSAEDQITAQFNSSKSIFLLQALMGSPGTEMTSQLLIVNKNTKNNPFVVLSTYDLLFDDKGNPKQLTANFSEITPLKSARSKDRFYNFAAKTTLSVTTGQTIAQLAKLQS